MVGIIKEVSLCHFPEMIFMSVFVYVEKFRPNFSSLSFEIQHGVSFYPAKHMAKLMVENDRTPIERRNLRRSRNVESMHGTALIKGFT